jgi:hypothetical protein
VISIGIAVAGIAAASEVDLVFFSDRKAIGYPNAKMSLCVG